MRQFAARLETQQLAHVRDVAGGEARLDERQRVLGPRAGGVAVPGARGASQRQRGGDAPVGVAEDGLLLLPRRERSRARPLERRERAAFPS